MGANETERGPEPATSSGWGAVGAGRAPEGRGIVDLFRDFDQLQRQLTGLEGWVTSESAADRLPEDVESAIERTRTELHDRLAAICLKMTTVPSTNLSEAVMKAKALLWLLPEEDDASGDLARSHCVDVIRLTQTLSVV